MFRVELKKLDFGGLIVVLSALFIGLALYFLTAPQGDFFDSPPTKTFLLWRWTWFPICEIICLFFYFAFFRLLKKPCLKKPLTLIFSTVLAATFSVVCMFLLSDVYQGRQFPNDLYYNHLDVFIVIIGLCNILSLSSTLFL